MNGFSNMYYYITKKRAKGKNRNYVEKEGALIAF